jgi:hypothetical protein
MKKLHSWIRQSSGAVVSLLALMMIQAYPAAGQSKQTFSFAVIGDIGYFPQEEVGVEHLWADLNHEESVAFVVHVGDLALPRFACTDDVLQRRLGQFRNSEHPLIYTPGDNDWTDCHEPAVKAGDPLARLKRVRELFFVDEKSLGHQQLPLTRQSQTGDGTFINFDENAQWDFGGVTFTTLHVVGSNNGLGQSPEGDAEYSERNNANLAWLKEAFRHADEMDSHAIVILQQANIFPDFSPAPTIEQGASGISKIRELLEAEVKTFGKPVLLVHGDTHYFRIDNPLAPRAKRGELGVPALENFTRIETFGTPYNHWVQVHVDSADPGVFSFRSRIVGANVLRTPH